MVGESVAVVDPASSTSTEAAESTRFTQDVHIIPVAREIDRAVLPFLGQNGSPPVLHAHRVLLVVPDAEPSRRLASKVEEQLKPLAQVERHIIDGNGGRTRPELDLERLLENLSRLCAKELGAGNRVHINLSSGSKLVAFAAGIVGMTHIVPGKGSVYYVQPSGYSLSEAEFEDHGLSKGMLEVRELQLMPLLLPPPLGMRILTFLKNRDDQMAEYRELVKFLAEIPGSGYQSPSGPPILSIRNWNNAVTTRLVRNLVVPLQSDGLVEIRDMGRQRGVRLTSRGGLYACLGGSDGTDLRRPL